jgi:subtilisin family serine protease
MKHLIGLLALVLALAGVGGVAPAAASGPRAAARPARTGVVPGQYIVTLKAGVRPAGFLASSGIATRYVYDAAMNGFSARLSQGQLAALRRSPSVVRIEQDRYVAAFATQSPVGWGLDRIDQRNLPLSNSYTYNTTAANVNVYVLDTGIQTSHPEFGGRAAVAYDAIGDGYNGQDCNGHGTHIAGLVGSKTYGVAKGVKLWSVRVLNCSGSGTITGVINGINWVASNHVKPAVANMSIGSSANTSVDNAVTNLFNAGVVPVVAVSGSASDSCSTSPARAAGAIGAGSSDSSDNRSSFSSYGACTDIHAPGANIISTWIGSSTRTLSGTSLSAGYVSGVVALYLAGNPAASPAAATNWLLTNATTGVLNNVPAGTPNRLVYKAGL